VAPTPPRWVAINFLSPGVRVGEQVRRWGFIELSGEQTVPPAAVSGWKAESLTLAERRLRTPELRGLETAKIVLVGAGSLGSKVAVELAKAGCGAIVLVDHDVYEAGNAVRHELAPLHAEEGKADALSRALELTNPFCKVTPVAVELGKGSPLGEVMEQIAGADLLVETTGERALTRLCERYCRIADTRLLSASLTRGSRRRAARRRRPWSQSAAAAPPSRAADSTPPSLRARSLGWRSGPRGAPPIRRSTTTGR
jgi:molybdopterin/thiamine biosynthesis adenylyltransferase